MEEKGEWPDKAIRVEDEEGAWEVADIIGSQVNLWHRVSGLKDMEQRLILRFTKAKISYLDQKET